MLKVTMPDFTVKLEPGGSAGFPGFGVMLTFGVAEAPPVYFSWGVVHTGGFADTEHVALVVVQATRRNTKIEVGTPCARPTASSTRTTNEKVPGAVGLPVAMPFEDKVTPPGRAPDEIDHLYGFTPPAATRVTVPYVTPTSPMWKGTVLMISFAGLGDAAVGEVAGDGVSDGVGSVLGVVATVGVASGEFVAVWFVCVQPVRTKTNPATHAAGTTPLLTKL
jgi:hypothetical protein